MASPQTLSEAERRLVAAWAADCAERVVALFEAEAPADGRPRDAIARARAFARGELSCRRPHRLSAAPGTPRSIASALHVIGERWTLLVLLELRLNLILLNTWGTKWLPEAIHTKESFEHICGHEVVPYLACKACDRPISGDSKLIWEPSNP